MTVIIDGSASAEFETPLPVAEGGTGVATSTGSGNVVLSASPTLTGTIGAAALTLTTPLPVASGGTGATSNAGRVLQVVSTNYTAAASSTSATPADVSGFAATITPSSTSSTILVMVSVAFGFAADAYPYVLLKRNGTSIGVGTQASGSQINTFLSGTATAIGTLPYRFHQFSKDYEDSPSSTSALTYQIALASPYAGHAGYINRQSATTNAVYIQFPTSSITLMEIGR